MLGMNRVTLLGHAGRNPEMRKLSSGDDVAQFSLATTERFRRKDDTVGEATEWHSVVAFGAAAEAVRKLVRKGDPVLVEGRISTRSWTDRKGAERRATEIVVSGPRGQVNVLAKRKRGGDGNGGDDDPPGGAAAAGAASGADPGQGAETGNGAAQAASAGGGDDAPGGGDAGVEAAVPANADAGTARPSDDDDDHD